MVTLWGLLMISALLWVVREFIGFRSSIARCSRCKYDMSHATSLTCPECGKEFADTNAMVARRRHPKRIVLSLIAATIAGVGLVVVVKRELSWADFVPSSALVHIAPLEMQEQSNLGNDLFWELNYREGAVGGLSAENHAIVYSRVIEQGLKDGTMIKSRSTWPKDLPVRLLVSRSPWLVSRENLQLVFRSVDGEVLFKQELPHPVPAIHPANPVWADRSVSISQEQLTAGKLELDVQIETVDGRVVASQRYHRMFSIADQIDDVITPVDSEEMRQALMDTLAMGIQDHGEFWPPPLRFWIEPTPTPLFNGVALGLHVAFLHDGKEVATSRFYLTEGQGTPHRRNAVAIEGNVRELLLADRSDPQWSVRISGDAELALRVLDKDRYWSGTIVVPLSSLDFD